MYLAIVLLLALFVAVFALQNDAAVPISFLVFKLEVSLVYVILGAALAGAAAGAIPGVVRQCGLRRRLRTSEQARLRLERELAQVRDAERSQATASAAAGERDTTEVMGE